MLQHFGPVGTHVYSNFRKLRLRTSIGKNENLLFFLCNSALHQSKVKINSKSQMAAGMAPLLLVNISVE